MMNPLDEDTINELVALAVAFHIKTGASVQDIQEFMAAISRINSKVAIKIMKEEVDKL